MASVISTPLTALRKGGTLYAKRINRYRDPLPTPLAIYKQSVTVR